MAGASIFAAVDAGGDIRFVGDVPSGSACGCFCVACKSPLVAKKGDINAWHFSHEARQERPECLVGAINLLRRIAVDYLKSLPTLELPRYSQVVTRAISLRRFQKEVSWEVRVTDVEWLELKSREAAAASLKFETGNGADLFVDITNAPGGNFETSSATGGIVFICSVPPAGSLKTEADARQHVMRHGWWHWLHLPDVHGLVADVRRRFDALAAEEAHAVAERMRRNNEYLGRREAERPVVPYVATPGALSGIPEWARHRKPNRSFFGYRYELLGVWVIFEMADGRWGVRKLQASGAWFEEPADPRLVYDAALDLVIAPSLQVAQSAFREPVKGTSISTSFSDVMKLLQP